MADEQAWQQFRDEVRDHETAQLHAWDVTVRALQDVQTHLRDQNVGLARDALNALLDQLPHDSGHRRDFPLLEDQLQQVRARRVS